MGLVYVLPSLYLIIDRKIRIIYNDHMDRLNRLYTIFLLAITLGLLLWLIGAIVKHTPVEGTHEVEGFEVSGIASNYPCTAGWCDGTATVALPQALGGRYDGTAHGYVEVCGERCAVLPVVDYCHCYWGTSEQRIVDLNYSAWVRITDAPLSRGLLRVTVRSVREDDSSITFLPDTSIGDRPFVAACSRWESLQ
jgi:hypothetical protein